MRGQVTIAELTLTIGVFVRGSFYYLRFRKFPNAAPQIGTKTTMIDSFYV